MPNPISLVFASILAIMMMYYVPTYQVYKKQEDLAYVTVYNATTQFVDNVRMKGFITPQMVEDFQRKLNVGDVLYSVNMIHKHKVYTPVYTDPTNENTFQGDYQVDYEEFHTVQIENYLFKEQGTPYKDRMYKLENGDFFEVLVENQTKFKSTMLFDFLTGGIRSDDVVVSIPYGGMVLNEDY